MIKVLKLGEICRQIRGSAFFYTERTAKKRSWSSEKMGINGALGGPMY